MARGSLLLAAWRVNRVFPLLVAALIMLNIAAYLFTTWHVAPWVDGFERRYTEQQERQRLSLQGVAATVTPQSIFRQGQEDLQIFRAEIPSKVHFPALIGELFSLAAETGLVIERVNYEPKEIEERGLLRYGLVFSVAGTYGQIKRFIFSLEQSPRLIVIEEISLAESAAADSGSARVALRVRLATFFSADAS